MKQKEILATLAILGTVVASNTTAAHAEVKNPNLPKHNNTNLLAVNNSANTKVIGEVTNTSFLHFRSGAGLNYPIIQTLNGNQKMDIIAQYGTWYQVNINGTTGYVDSSYVKILNPDALGTATLVNTTFLHFRQGPSVDTSIISTLNENSIINVLAQRGSWYEVEVNGQIGYVDGYYIQLSNNNSNSNSNNSSSTTNNSSNSIGTGTLVNTTFLHFRQGPSIDTNIISTLNENSKITVLAKDGSWYKVEVNGQIGYVDGYYLQVSDNNSSNNSNNSQSNNSNSTQGMGTGSLINTTFLHLRDGASTNTNIIETLNTNSNIIVLAKDGAWYKVSVNGTVGYVYGYYLQVSPNNNSNSSQSNNNSSNVQGIGTGSLANTTFLHLRDGASLETNIIETIYPNDSITVLAKDGAWYKVSVNGTVGYVYGYYLNVTPNKSSNNSNNNSNTSNDSQSNSTSSNVKGIGTGSLTNTTFLHFRKEATIDSSIISTLNENSKITVLAKDGEWYKVEVNGQVGYVYGYYLKVTPNKASNTSNGSQSNDTSSDVKGIGTGSLVNTTFLHFRKEATIDSSIISTLNENSKITVLAKDGEWYKVEVNGQVGYVYGYYLKVTSNGTSNNSNNNSGNSQQDNNTVNSIGTGSLVNTTFLHLRQEPTVNSNIISTLNENSKINVIAKEGYWYKVEVNGKIGYVDGYYLNVKYNGNSSNISSRYPTPNSNEITTNYPISLQQYVNLQQQAWPLFSAQQFENAINPKSISNMFEFLRIDQFRDVHLNKLNQLLEGCGVLTGQGQAFIDACQKYNIDPVYFVNQSILETGYGSSRLASGVTISQIAIPSEPIYNSNGQLVGYQMKKLPHPVTVYNLFGIGAYDNSSVFPNRALILGTTYAYNHGWTSVPNAIAGAAEFVSNGYIHNSYYNQNTVYKLRYSPVINSLWHQYATNYAYANEIANLMEQNMDLYDSGDQFTYDVPVFQN